MLLSLHVIARGVGGREDMRFANVTAALIISAAVAHLAVPGDGAAMCGCDKPPPPRAAVRPFVGYPDQIVVLFDDRLDQNGQYTVVFTSRDGSQDWSRAHATVRRDFADGVNRRQLRVAVPNVAFGPASISVFDPNDTLVYTLSDEQFTVIAPPIALHDFAETITRLGFQTGVSADGTMYLAFDATDMSDATTYTGSATGLGLRFASEDVLIYNAQGFFGGWLDPTSPGLFRLTPGTGVSSDVLSYWRHEFRTYKQDHRKRDAHRVVDGEWHADGTPHVDNFHFVVAITGTLDDGRHLPAGPTPAFRLDITSSPSPDSKL